MTLATTKTFTEYPLLTTLQSIAQGAIVKSKMFSKRVFKTKTFDRWAKKVIPDYLLCIAAQEIIQGNFDADLGGGVCKKRIALPKQGKSGSTRTLVAKKHKLAIFFIVGRKKSDPGTDFSVSEEEAAKTVAKGLQAANESKINELKQSGILKEICNAETN